jgi:hypothetical protein
MATNADAHRVTLVSAAPMTSVRSLLAGSTVVVAAVIYIST